MDRPSKERVDAAIDLDSIKYEPLLDAYNVLRAEVMAAAAVRAGPHVRVVAVTEANQEAANRMAASIPQYLDQVEALVNAARALVEMLKHDDDYPFYRGAVEAALQPFSSDWTPLGEATKGEM